jgi:Toprim-like/Protein of unknown function (DUF3991)
MDPELERFKSEIDLRQFAASMGYTLDPQASWGGSAVMRTGRQSEGGDKVIIKRETDGHYVYFSVRDDADNGTIIDFLQRRQRIGLGEIRKTLRPWIGKPESRPPLPLTNLPQLEQSGCDRPLVEKEWAQSGVYGGSSFLEEVRRIPRELLSGRRFIGRLRIDSRLNVLFPHEDREGDLCGFEKKNRGFTGFSTGGEKGLWRSNDFETDRRLVFAESAIDALSYATLFPDPTARYRSFGGGLSPKQPEIIRNHVCAMPPGSEIVAATDADHAGFTFARRIEEVVADLDGHVFRRHSPPGDDDDWNEVLKRDSLLPAAPFSYGPFGVRADDEER